MYEGCVDQLHVGACGDEKVLVDEAPHGVPSGGGAVEDVDQGAEGDSALEPESVFEEAFIVGGHRFPQGVEQGLRVPASCAGELSTGVVTGSDAISMTSGRCDNTCFEQIQLSAAVHLPLGEFELGDLAFLLAVRPHRSYSILDRCPVADDAVSE